ncbi:hypothetical protein Tco_0395393, partial [Tanacetum coccineum]
MKSDIERSKIQTHSSYASGSGDGVDTQLKFPDEQQQNLSGTNERAGDKPEVPDVPEYRSENDNQENDSQRTESDDEGDDFVHPNLSFLGKGLPR